jgi:ABC-type nitrate/sulfonate/bicarbonate transport system permease component
MWATIILVGVLGLTLNKCLEAIQRLTVYWRED